MVTIVDYREKWFADRISNYFGESDSRLLENYLNRSSVEHCGGVGGAGDGSDDHPDDDSPTCDDSRSAKRQQFDALLDVGAVTDSIFDVRNRVFVVYKTYYSKMVEEEIETREEGECKPIRARMYYMHIVRTYVFK